MNMVKVVYGKEFVKILRELIKTLRRENTLIIHQRWNLLYFIKMLFKITQKQVGNGIGSILASIAIPMVLDAIRGKGVGRGGPRMGKASGGGGPRIGPPMAPPPYIGTWGRGKKKA